MFRQFFILIDLFIEQENHIYIERKSICFLEKTFVSLRECAIHEYL